MLCLNLDKINKKIQVDCPFDYISYLNFLFQRYVECTNELKDLYEDKDGYVNIIM